MADECVVCGEAEEGKPLYKKLGSGEFNVEVITALKALQMLSIPEAAKNSSYICWDCDELVVEQYDSYLREQQAAAVVQKQAKKQQQQDKKKKKRPPSKLKLKISKDTKRDSNWGITKPQSQKPSTKKSSSVSNSSTSGDGTNLSKTKQLEQRRATNAYHSAHCLMCDNNFETERRIYQRFNLKKRINDDMDIAQVMEVLGLAKHIDPDLKGRRYVCNPCFFIIRRNYKDKLLKETTEDGKPAPLCPTPTSLGSQKAIHRATTEEHAAEIAKLLPPGLAECYKIVTENGVNTRCEPVQTSQKSVANENSCVSAEEREGEEEEDEEEEEEEGGLQVSQDEHGNYFIDIPDKEDVAENTLPPEQGETPSVPHTARRKKNVLLPRRMHKHLSLSPQATPDKYTDSSMEDNEDDKDEKECKKTSSPSVTNAQESRSGRKCNICGITIAGKPSSWWHTLTSPVEGFETINVTTALKLLETCLTSINPSMQEDQSVCLPCYTKVSSGIKSQVIQRIARHKNMDASEVNLSRVKVRMLPKETTEPGEVAVLQKSISETPECSEMSGSSKRLTAVSEESGEGEKENMDIDKCGHKRKLSEGNVLPDKKRKLYKSDVNMTRMSVLDSSETKTSQACSSLDTLSVLSPKDGRGSPCKRGNNRRFLKRGKNKRNVTQEAQQAENLVTDSEEGESPDSQAWPETVNKTNKECKETEPLVVLKDLKFVLPQEAFSGKTVSSHKIESIMEPSKLLSPDHSLTSHSELGTTSSPLQLVFSALSTYHPPPGITREAPSPPTTLDHTAKVNGCCVVCGGKYLVPVSCWHSVEEDIRPPTLLVPVRWVCISLTIALPEVSVEDAHHARVCKKCFEKLGDQFEVFVKRKVGESCGLEAESVDLSEYLFTFNTETMNLEADPKQQSYIHEFEDVGQLLQRIQVLMEQFSLDEVVSEGKRQPVLERHFCVWLLLVLNELRMQVGAAIGDLATWLVALMPVHMYESGVRPCPNNLASFLLNTTRCSKALTEDVLEGPIPAWVFVTGDTSHTGQTSSVQDDKNHDEDLCWEDFLHHVNLDALVGGRATPVSTVHFTQGLVYAVWRTSLLLGEGENQVVDWLRQLSPLPLSREQLENLVTMIGQLHNHLEDHPQDIHELECAIIPQLNEHCSSHPPSDSMKLVNTSPPSVQAYKSCVSEEDTSSVVTHNTSKSRRDKSTPHVNKIPEPKKDQSNVQSNRKTPTRKYRKESPSRSYKRSKRRRSPSSERHAKVPKRNGSRRATVNNSSQDTPLIGDAQPSPPPSDNHLDDSNTTLATSQSIQDTSMTHKPGDDAAVCEPNPTVLPPHPGSTQLSEQHSVDTTPTTNTVKSKDTVVTNGSSNKSPTNTEFDTDVVAKNTVPTTECADTNEASEQTNTTTDVLENTITNGESNEEIASITATSEQQQPTLTGESDKTLPVSESSEQISDESNEESLLDSDASDQTSDELDEETSATDTSGKTTTTTTDESDEEALPVTGTSQDTKAIGTSEQAAAFAGSDEVKPTEPSLKISPSNKSSEKITPTTNSAEEIGMLKSTVEDTVATTTGTFEESTPTTKPVEDTIIKSSDKSASFMEPTKDTVASKCVGVTGSSQQTPLPKGTSKNVVTSGTLDNTAVSNGTLENTALTSGDSEKTAVARESSEKIAVKTSQETVLNESSEVTTTTEESLENTHPNLTQLTAKIPASLTPADETGTSNRTSGKTAPTSGYFKETETTSACQGDTTLTKETGTAQESSRRREATHSHSEKTATSVHSRENTTNNITLATADGNFSITTAGSYLTDNRMNTAITTTHHPPSLSSTTNTLKPHTGDMPNTKQTTSSVQKPVTTRDTDSDRVKAEISKTQGMKCDKSITRTLGSFKTQVSSPNKTCSDNTAKKTSGQALGHRPKVILKRTNEYNQNTTNSQQSALRKSTETQIEFEPKSEHHVNVVKQNGSKSNSPKKIQVVIVPKKQENRSHKVEDSVDECREKAHVQILHRYKTDSPQEKNVRVVPSKNSKDAGTVLSQEKTPQEVPVVVSRSKPPLHRSERVSIKVLSKNVKSSTPESHKNENSVESKKDEWHYQKERLKSVKEDNIIPGSSISLGKLQEDKEGNNNTKISSPSLAKVSSKNIVRLVGVNYNRDKLKHNSTCSKSEKYQLEDTNPCTVQKVNEVVSKQKNFGVEKNHKVTSTSVKKVKNTSVENNCDKGNDVEEMPNNSEGEKKSTNKKYHRPLTPKVDMDDEKKFHEKSSSKSLLLEENKQSKIGKFSSPASIPERCASKSPPDGVTPGKQGAPPCRTSTGKKQKLTFEELMNYDAGGLGHS